ncbi:MAG: hypothetical protein ACRCUT_03255, partial [Spirochaetota bacterium]
VDFIEGIGVSITGAEKKGEATLEAISQQKKIREEMIEKTERVREKSGIISNASREQSSAINEIVSAIEDTSSMVQNVAEHVQMLKSDYEKLKKLADGLNMIISRDSSSDYKNY